MQTLEIKVPDEKTPLIKALLKELGIEIKVKKGGTLEPNSETIAAMQELKAGEGKRFDSVDALFDSV